jgi:hypothetical protein
MLYLKMTLRNFSMIGGGNKNDAPTQENRDE